MENWFMQKQIKQVSLLPEIHFYALHRHQQAGVGLN